MGEIGAFVFLTLCLFQDISAQRNRIPQKWTDGIVPYTISPKFSPADLKAILEVFPIFSQQACIRFKPRLNETSYIQISRGMQCSAAIGRTGGPQPVLLAPSCLDKRSILREMMHVLGFNDEHLRSDRDDFITVNRNNIKQADWIFFDKLTDKELPRFNQPYDFDSVLQRPGDWKVDPTAKSGAVSMFNTKNPKQPLGQSISLTHLDINKIKSLYNC